MTPVVLILRGGGEYTAEHVLRLKKQLPNRPVVVYTDLSVDGDVETRPLRHEWEGWWAKMEMFRHEGPFLYVDLDTTIRRDISCLIETAKPHGFVALRDVYRGIKNPGALQSSIMYSDGSHGWLYEQFRDKPEYLNGGDQIYVEKYVKKPTFWQDITDEVTSYKVPNGNDDPSVVIFHGKPRPWEVK